MSSALLKEYRCSCGKLLLKGFFYQCIVEIKCRRCGALVSWGTFEAPGCAVIESDTRERITGVTGDTGRVLGSEREHLLGKTLAETLSPFSRDIGPDSSLSYRMLNTALLLRDGQSRPLASCIVPRTQNGAFSGYRIYAVLQDSIGLARATRIERPRS